jgi:hypothetical protein
LRDDAPQSSQDFSKFGAFPLLRQLIGGSIEAEHTIEPLIPKPSSIPSLPKLPAITTKTLSQSHLPDLPKLPVNTGQTIARPSLQTLPQFVSTHQSVGQKTSLLPSQKLPLLKLPLPRLPESWNELPPIKPPKVPQFTKEQLDERLRRMRAGRPDPIDQSFPQPPDANSGKYNDQRSLLKIYSRIIYFKISKNFVYNNCAKLVYLFCSRLCICIRKDLEFEISKSAFKLVQAISFRI